VVRFCACFFAGFDLLPELFFDFFDFFFDLFLLAIGEV
jgi:hypothetical protein